MSRLEEVEAEIVALQKQEAWGDNASAIARTLAAEVDDRDAVITELLAMLRDAKGKYFGSITVYERALERAGKSVHQKLIRNQNNDH